MFCFYKFYIFEAKEFENGFYKNKDFEKLYKRAKNCDADISLGDFIRKGKFKHKIRLKLNKEEEFVGDNEKFYGSQFYHFPCVWNKIYKTSKFNDLRFIEGI